MDRLSLTRTSARLEGITGSLRPCCLGDWGVKKMRNRNPFLRVGLRGNRRIAALVAGAFGAVLLLSLGAGALAAQGTNVVPARGKVAGHGYAYWMERHWQFAFSLSASAARSPNPCHTLTANGKQVAWLIGPYSTGNHACSEPAGRPIYVNVVSAWCDTFPGDHSGFGTSDAQLQLCSKTNLAGAGTPSAAVDGQAVNVKALAGIVQ